MNKTMKEISVLTTETLEEKQVSFQDGKVELNVGLNAILLPPSSVGTSCKWASSDRNIAYTYEKDNKIYIKAVGIGLCSLTAFLKDGSLSQTFSITVKSRMYEGDPTTFQLVLRSVIGIVVFLMLGEGYYMVQDWAASEESTLVANPPVHSQTSIESSKDDVDKKEPTVPSDVETISSKNTVTESVTSTFDTETNSQSVEIPVFPQGLIEAMSESCIQNRDGSTEFYTAENITWVKTFFQVDNHTGATYLLYAFNEDYYSRENRESMGSSCFGVRFEYIDDGVSGSIQFGDFEETKNSRDIDTLSLSIFNDAQYTTVVLNQP